MKAFVCLLLCLNMSLLMAQERSKAVQKNNEAVSYIMRGLTENPDSVRKAISLLDEAIAIDPSYRLAYENKIQFLMYLPDKVNALKTFAQIERLGALKPAQLLYKGMLLELNGQMDESMKIYVQVASLLEKQVKEKPDVALFMNYVAALYLKDGKKYTFDEIMKDVPDAATLDKDKWVRDFMTHFYSQNRDKVVEFLLLGQK